LLVTSTLLFYIFRRIDFSGVWVSVQRMDGRWFALAFLSYGFALLCGAGRWHVALHVTGAGIHALASWRLFLIGHFFFVVLFGAAGGDLAKSAVYARWYRLSLPEVIAAVPLDRGLGVVGPLLLLGLLFGLAAASGGFPHSLAWPWPGAWLVLGGSVLAVGLGIVFWRPRGENVWAQTVRAFRAGGARMILRPHLAGRGLLFAVFAQLGLSAVLAFNLQALSPAFLPWAQLGWTFPVITALSCLPFTVAGAGVREAAALAFLGLYGIPAADCVAAALLTLVQKLVWAVVGGGVWARDESLFAKKGGRPLARTISVVIPVLNEASAMGETVGRARAVPEVSEIIVVDGGSRDATPEVAAQLGCRVLRTPSGRGGQMRAGAAQATGDVVLLLHADTWLPPEAGRAALNCLRDPTVAGGGFWKVFRDTPLLLLGSRWKCAVRLLLGRRIVGDQAMFIRRETLEQIGGVPDMPLMEEFELCRRLHKVGRLALAEATVSTSARRFTKLGVIRTYLRMWRVSTLYRLGVSPQQLRRLYEAE
jgi:rSAM/selenodomain-associated transferase 2